MKNVPGIKSAKKIVLYQFLVAAFVSFFTYVVSGKVSAQSVFIGGLIAILPLIFFASCMFLEVRVGHAKSYIKRVYRAEAVKILLTALLFALVFCFLKIIPFALFLGYIVVQSVIWIVPWIFR